MIQLQLKEFDPCAAAKHRQIYTMPWLYAAAALIVAQEYYIRNGSVNAAAVDRFSIKSEIIH